MSTATENGVIFKTILLFALFGVMLSWASETTLTVNPITGPAPLTVSITGGCGSDTEECELFIYDPLLTHDVGTSGTEGRIFYQDSEGHTASLSTTYTFENPGTFNVIMQGILRTDIILPGPEGDILVEEDFDTKTIIVTVTAGSEKPIVPQSNPPDANLSILPLSENAPYAITAEIDNGCNLPNMDAESCVISGNAPLTVTYTGGCSNYDVNPTSCMVYFGEDSPILFSSGISHTYTTPGNYVANLTATDQLDRSNSDFIKVIVSCVPNWSCTEWTDCVSADGQGKRTRNCTDTNACNTLKNKPIEWEFCVYKKPSVEVITTIAPPGEDGGSTIVIRPVEVIAEEPVAVSPTTVTQISTSTLTVSKCPISDSLMKKYDQLITELRKAESEDKERAEEITKKIIALKEEIAKDRKECVSAATSVLGVVSEPAVSVTAIKPITIDRCKEIEQWESKYAYYKELYSLPDEEIKKKGYSNREEIKKILTQLSDGIGEIKGDCGEDVWIPVLTQVSRTCSDGSVTECKKEIIEKCGVNTFSIFNQCGDGTFRNVYVECHDGFEVNEGGQTSCKSSLSWQSFAKETCEKRCKKIETIICSACPKPERSITVDTVDISKPKPIELIAVIKKPVIVNSGDEITEYYKIRIESITSLDDAEEQITDLKELREEIDNLIENLIKSKDVLAINDVAELVTEIKVSAGEINADNIKIKTIGKKILMDISNTAISIEPTETGVIIKDGNLEINAVAISIKENILMVGNAEVRIAASDAVRKLKITLKTAELREENSRAVYKIKADEDRKLLGFIPITMEKEFTIDAVDGSILTERGPWYSFLTTK